MGNVEFLKGMFREYYLKNDLILPPRFNRREYGFMFFDKKYVLRHISFHTKKDIKRFFLKQVPRHAYYSAAYYKYPDKQDMEGKGWLGADLIFDLDADHIPGAEKMKYGEMLKTVKKEAEKLIYDYLLNDFGFSEKSLSLSFSGGRGYHIHVRSEDVYSLSSDERREIVSYITGENAEITKFLNIIGRKKRKRYILYPEDYGGWYGKVRRGIDEISRELFALYENGREEKLLEEINKVLNNKKSSKMVVRELLSETQNYSTKLERLAKDERSVKLQVLKDKVRDLYLSYIKNKISIKGETDEPVTTDIHRLIRLTGSLHGKTGFIVKPLKLEDFKDFNPLKDAIPDVFMNGESKVIVNGDVEVELNGKTYRISGEDCVPDYVAVFLVARNMADFVTKC